MLLETGGLTQYLRVMPKPVASVRDKVRGVSIWILTTELRHRGAESIQSTRGGVRRLDALQELSCLPRLRVAQRSNVHMRRSDEIAPIIQDGVTSTGHVLGWALETTLDPGQVSLVVVRCACQPAQSEVSLRPELLQPLTERGHPYHDKRRLAP